MTTSKPYSPEVRERAVRMIFDQQDEYESHRAANHSISEKIGCSCETLRKLGEAGGGALQRMNASA
jgi:transposase